ncbi:DNA polymerase-3 subunit alpha [Streptoalloteichus tenebrarius]|uniref:DNA polymerase III subunit alpha n=1 Tax=Streptoalloteichus tenebrarius (strain ATCC 17920 / DSM 40477 / JCM 4838 / CBS 697.72 / NBRC 16177 / NCIMB 11028 / NRRL B-12390 / A12253. 1 / ISP 5477) TaxID=1933 RepID=A0ABT1HNB4_STRSD|nr:DNA polymerase III subunit alpha [Streptoalloteichus tenebrarius]MCP2256985.1 DNA polymerase-3 subunit alpha [Streptoalloteichus tenebrarius]BFF00104.1 DNA polymerase III subunit alpha [Streptoalloteichus tenebrarius]
MAGDSFVHLHVHTEYSMLDGAAKLKDMFAECERLGMPAAAITDHGNMYGAYDFFKQATAAGIKPVIGIEAYMAPDSRFNKERVRWGDPSQRADDVSASGAYTHQTIWARTNEGLHNLMKVSSLASIEGQLGKWPRMDRELIAQHSAGLMATTGCPSGEVQTRLRLGHEREALEAAAAWRDIYGKDNFYVELMDHGIEIERRVRDGLLDLARKLDLRFVVTNDSHYTYADDRDAHDALLCVQTGKTLQDPNRFKFDGEGYYLKSPEEMRAIDSSDAWQEGCRNTLVIAEKVDTTGMFEFRNLMPRFPIPEGKTEGEYFREQVWEGMRRRFPNGIDEVHRQQVEFEIGVILQMGFPSYFLVVADFINWAKENGIRVGPGRGSAAGALIAYALGITDLDPLAHGLIFERFLNPDRVSPPDIDIDFDERRRGDVIRYVTQKWGEDKVAQVITFGTIKAKAAIKDAARVLYGQPGYAVADRISKAMPPAVMGKDIPLSGIFDPQHKRYAEAAEVRALYESDPQVKEIIDTGRGLEGLIRNAGVHACAVIMSSETLTDHIPVWMRPNDGAIITQFDYPTCETLGLLKMDFLGLSNLTTIDDALRNIELNGKGTIDIASVALDDKKTYELLSRGDTLGVFQLDGGALRDLLRLMRPDNFEDVSAVIALYRPGPMGANSHTNYALRKNGQQEITPIHPELAEPLAEILDTTYGLIVYQEQVMAIARKVAGYTLAQADLLRRAMGKKKKEILDKEFTGFEAGMLANGYSPEAIKTLWDILVPFADYAFNKAHSAAYGLVAYWTAYLKANYPAEYMAALLTTNSDNKDKSAIYLAECRRMGITVLPPDVNESEREFAPVGEDIRFGLGAIRNVGANVVDAIIKARKEKGKFTDFSDFLRKVDAQVCNKKVVESLIKAGAFDSLGHPRKGLHLVHADAIDAVMETKRAEAVGQFDLFGGDDAPDVGGVFDVKVPEEYWDAKHQLTLEREMLGLYVSGHPLNGVEHILTAQSDTPIATILEGSVPDGAQVTVGGILASVTRRVNKNGEPWAACQLEDLAGGIEVLFFPKSYTVHSINVVEDAIVLVKARVTKRDDRVSLIANDLVVPDLSDAGTQALRIKMHAAKCTEPLIVKLKDVLKTHPGTTEVHLKLVNGQRTTMLRVDSALRVSPSPSLMGDLKALLGPGCLG